MDRNDVPRRGGEVDLVFGVKPVDPGSTYSLDEETEGMLAYSRRLGRRSM